MSSNPRPPETPAPRHGISREQIDELIAKWQEDVATYPEATNEHARYAAGVLRLCIRELEVAIASALAAPQDWHTCSVEAKNGEGCGFQWRGPYTDCPSCTLQAAARALAAAPAWQSIETAPTDGASVLLFIPRHGLRRDPWAMAQGFNISADRRGWRLRTGGLVEPTHWMPLPAAPPPTEG